MLDGHGGSEIESHERFARAGIERCNHGNLVFASAGHELEIGTHHAERFVEQTVAVGLDNERRGFLDARFLADGVTPAATPAVDAVFARHFLGYFADKRSLDALEVGTATQAVVECLREEEYDGRDEQTYHQCHKHDVACDGRRWFKRAHRGCYDAGVVGCEGERQLILLTLLEQEEIERLFDLLLTLYRQQILGLGWRRGYLGIGLAVAALKGCELGAEHAQLSVERRGERGPDAGKRVVAVLDQRAVLAGGRQELVTLELKIVVFGYLSHDTLVLYAEIAG